MLRISFFILALCLSLSLRATAAVVQFEVTHREPYQEGQSFGDVGAYERLRGEVRFAVDPQHAANATIVDLKLAPRNASGQVEFRADFEMLLPVDRSKSNGAILYDVNNRGNKVCLGVFNGGGADNFLMRQGFIVVWSGWIAELLPGGGRLQLHAPIATENGRAITGIVRQEFVSNKDAARLPVSHFSNHGSYPPTDHGLKTARLTRKLRESDPRILIPRDQWRLVQNHVEEDNRRSILPKIEIEIAGGISSGVIYELVYEAYGPIVQGLGLAGIRDLVSFLKHENSHANPLAVGDRSTVRYAYGFGVSQSGRCLRQLVYDGFNADESGQIVFDGLIPHVAGGGMGYFNHRFASPTRHNTQHDNHLYPADVFPFTYGLSTDPFTGREDGILIHSQKSNTTPKVMHTQSSSEYWHRAGSLVHTDPLGTKDATIPESVRIYTFGGAQHGPGSGLVRERTNGQLPSNPTDFRPAMRGLLMALDGWVRSDIEPPPSMYPRLKDGSLGNWELHHSAWQALPGVNYPTVIHRPEFVDRGREFFTHRRSAVEPPKRLGKYTVRVPAYGADNNERGCLLMSNVAVPLATFTSWNLRSRELGAETELLSLNGGYIPLAATRETRLRSGDPRLSLRERYQDYETYLAEYQAHTDRLIQNRYVLEEDRPRMNRIAEQHRPLFVEP